MALLRLLRSSANTLNLYSFVEVGFSGYLCKMLAKWPPMTPPHTPLLPNKTTDAYSLFMKRAKIYHITYKTETQGEDIWV